MNCHGLIGVTDGYDNSFKVYTLDGHCVTCHRSQLSKAWGIRALPSGQFVMTDVEGVKLWCFFHSRPRSRSSQIQLPLTCCEARLSPVMLKAQSTSPKAWVSMWRTIRRNTTWRVASPSALWARTGSRTGRSVTSSLRMKISSAAPLACVCGCLGDLIVADSSCKEILYFPKGCGYSVLIRDGLYLSSGHCLHTHGTAAGLGLLGSLRQDLQLPSEKISHPVKR